MQRVTVKTSTIFIAKGGRTRVYRSVQRSTAAAPQATGRFHQRLQFGHHPDRRPARAQGDSAGLEGNAVGASHAAGGFDESRPKR